MKLTNYVRAATGFSGELQPHINNDMESFNAIVEPRKYSNGNVTWNELRFWPNGVVTYFRFKTKNEDATAVPRLRCKICGSELKTYASMCPGKAWNWICRETQVTFNAFVFSSKISEDMKREIFRVRQSPNKNCLSCLSTPAGKRNNRIRELYDLITKASGAITAAKDELKRLNNKPKMDAASAKLARIKSSSRISKKMRSTDYFQTIHAVNSITKQTTCN